MSLKETYMVNVSQVKKQYPDAEIVYVARRGGSVLAPSWDLLEAFKEERITWDEYIQRFVKEMDNPVSKAEMLRIGNLAKTKDVYLVCFERKGNCHRYLLVDMINKMMKPKPRGAICKYCGKEMGVVDSCGHPFIRIGNEVYARDTTTFDEGKRCHDCGILNKKGNLHHLGCDMERCPKCGGQLFICDCAKGNLLKKAEA